LVSKLIVADIWEGYYRVGNLAWYSEGKSIGRTKTERADTEKTEWQAAMGQRKKPEVQYAAEEK
jgi:hypothetical protein